jgi:hypothetical protein
MTGKRISGKQKKTLDAAKPRALRDSPAWPGYPLLGCTPAEPNSVSPGNCIIAQNGMRSSKIDQRLKRVHPSKIVKSAYRLDMSRQTGFRLDNP